MSAPSRDAVVFFAPGEKIDFLVKWYDSLSSTEVKDSIQIVRYFPPGQEGRGEMAVFCVHPFSDESVALQVAQSAENQIETDQALVSLVGLFRDWIDRDGPKNRAFPDDLQLVIRWWPLEMFDHLVVPESLQTTHLLELNDHTLDSLELIRFAIMEESAFLNLWQGSNEPFIAAGRMASAHFEWIRSFPDDWEFGPDFRKEINGRVLEFAREYIGLFRMAFAFGHRSPLMERLSEEIRAFRDQFHLHIPRWVELAAKCLDLENEMEEPLSLMSAGERAMMAQAAHGLRRQLAEATAGLEHHIPEVVNSFLPGLPLPKSAIFFQD